MSSLTRTARRANQRAGIPTSTATRTRGKRTPRPNIASMLTTVDWPTRITTLRGKKYDDGGYAARKEAWLVNFLAERASFGHAPNRERWIPKMIEGAPSVIKQAA